MVLLRGGEVYGGGEEENTGTYLMPTGRIETTTF
jgi:hypothetical protein